MYHFEFFKFSKNGIADFRHVNNIILSEQQKL